MLLKSLHKQGTKQIFTNSQDRVKMESFRSHIATPYNKDDASHENLLMDLWKVSYPSQPLENRVSQQWKQLGTNI